MIYHLSYSKKALNQIAHLPDELFEGVRSELRRLCESPTSVSLRIASPPFAPRGQLFHFTIEHVDVEQLWFFTVIFYYSQDETELEIISIMWREIAKD